VTADCPRCGHPWPLHDDPVLPCRGVKAGTGYADTCDCTEPIPDGGEMTDEYRRGFEAAVEACKAAVTAVPVETSSRPDAYSPWVYTDRRARDVRQDCIDAVSRVTPTA
jgi:hypothetical protein